MGDVEKAERSSVGLSMGTCGIRTARISTSGDWVDGVGGEQFDQWQMSPSAEDVARSVRAIVDREDAPQSLAVAYREPGSRAAITAAISEEYVSDVHTLDETAASLEYLRPQLPAGVGTVALFDIGETGLVVDVVDVESGRSYGGVRSGAISGAGFDRVVAEHILGLGIYRPPVDADEDRALLAFCRGIKEALSTHTVARTPDGDITLLERHIFELSIARPVEQAAALVRQLGLQAEFYPEMVVLLGGTAHIPLIAQVLERYLGIAALVPDAPELVVARGAALYADRMDHLPAAAPPPRRLSLTRIAAFALPALAVVGSIGLFSSGAVGGGDPALGNGILSSDSAPVTSAAPETTDRPSTTLPPPPDPAPPPETTPAPEPAPAAPPSGGHNRYVPPPPPPPPTLPLPQIPGIEMPVIPLPVLPPLPFG